MDNYLLEIIKKTTEYIEANLLEELNLDNISENVNITKFHLLRIWKGATLTGLMEYVRRRRIALSLSDLIREQNTINFISSKYSFGCERTYNRVFKEEFKTSPAKWRKNPTPLQILDHFNADFMNQSGEALIFFRSITVLPAFTIAGLEYEVNIEDNLNNQTSNLHGVDFYTKHSNRIANTVNKDIYVGYTSIFSQSCPYTLYQPSIPVDGNSIIPPGMKIKHIKPHKYGVFTYMGLHRPEEISSKTLKHIWNYVVNTWKPTLRFDLKEDFRFEYIDFSKCNKQYCECDLYFPITMI